MTIDWLSDLTGLVFQDIDPARSGQDALALLPPERLLQAVTRVNDHKFFIEDLTVADVREGLLLSYHFCQYEPHLRLTLRTMVTHEQPTLSSISAIFPGANWHEREAAEMFGLVFSGHPHLQPLLLDDQTPGPPPLLKMPEARRGLADLLLAVAGQA